MPDVFYEHIADSKVDKFIMSINAAKHSEIIRYGMLILRTNY